MHWEILGQLGSAVTVQYIKLCVRSKTPVTIPKVKVTVKRWRTFYIIIHTFVSRLLTLLCIERFKNNFKHLFSMTTCSMQDGGICYFIICYSILCYSASLQRSYHLLSFAITSLWYYAYFKPCSLSFVVRGSICKGFPDVQLNLL